MTWTAYYAPKEEELVISGFYSPKEAKQYVKSRVDLDEHAWFILRTEVYDKCETFEEIMWGAGYYPSKRLWSDLDDGKLVGHAEDVGSTRWAEYVECCKKLGIEPGEDVSDDSENE
jgi:hypothetical protein